MDFPPDSESEDRRPSELWVKDPCQCTELSTQDQDLGLEEERETDSPSIRSDIFDLASLEYLTMEEEERSLKEGQQFLDRRNLLNKLVTVLKNRLSVANCLFLFRVASPPELNIVNDACHDIICSNFPKVVETSRSFLDLSLEELRHIVFSDLLHATEEHIFNSIVLWIQTDLLRRRCHVSELMAAVRINRCSLRFLRQTMNHFLVQKEHWLLEAVEERIQYLTMVGLLVDRFATKDLNRAGNRDILFVMGGLETINSMETLDPTVGSWVYHSIDEVPRNSTWMCSVGHKILVLEVENRKFRSFDVETRIWAHLRPPPHHKHESSAAYYDHHVYLLGGGRPHNNRCYGYDVRADLWEEMASTRERRVWAASACHARKLYCTGGESEPSTHILSSMEVLDLQGDGEWSVLPSLGVKRASHCLVSCGRFLWAIGGDNGDEILKSVERFDVERCWWSHVKPLNVPRSDMSVSVLHGQIHVIAGWTAGERSVPTVEVYDAEEDRWDYTASLHDGRDFHSSCVVRSLLDEDALKYAVPIQ